MIGPDQIARAEQQATWHRAEQEGVDFKAVAAHMRSSLEEQEQWFETMVRDLTLSSRTMEEAVRHMQAAVWAQGFLAGVIAARDEAARRREHWPTGDTA